MVSKEKYTWKQFDRDSKKIAKAFSYHQGIIRNIYGIPRGGLVLAVKLSHLLDVPILINVSRIGPETLIVDDIIDTGVTLKRVVGKRKHFATAVLWWNPSSEYIPTVHSNKKEKGRWVVFPWETIGSSKYDRTV